MDCVMDCAMECVMDCDADVVLVILVVRRSGVVVIAKEGSGVSDGSGCVGVS